MYPKSRVAKPQNYWLWRFQTSKNSKYLIIKRCVIEYLILIECKWICEVYCALFSHKNCFPILYFTINLTNLSLHSDLSWKSDSRDQERKITSFNWQQWKSWMWKEVKVWNTMAYTCVFICCNFVINITTQHPKKPKSNPFHLFIHVQLSITQSAIAWA